MSDRENQATRFSLGVGSSRRQRDGFRASMLPASGRARPSPPSTAEQSDTQQFRVCDELTDSEESSGGSGSGSLVIICDRPHDKVP